jgi:hypothetical protein
MSPASFISFNCLVMGLMMFLFLKRSQHTIMVNVEGGTAIMMMFFAVGIYYMLFSPILFFA